MRILQATSEFYPYSKTGGLADMVAGLSGALERRAHELTVATPLYRGIKNKFKKLDTYGMEFQVTLGKNIYPGQWWNTRDDSGVSVLFLESKEFFDREGLYTEDGAGYGDNPERFMYLSKAVAELSDDFDVVHVHDWQTAFIPMLINLGPNRKKPRTVITIHNLAHQGICEGARFIISNLPQIYFQKEGPEFWGRLNFLKAGLHYADSITTVSPQYAKEILTKEFGEGLEGVLRSRKNDLIGVLNGVDYDEWRTVGNPHLPADFSVEDISGKTICKNRVLEESGLKNLHLPLFGIVSRFARQKGIELLLDSIVKFLKKNQLQMIVLGEGDQKYIDKMVQLQNVFPDLVSVFVGYDGSLAHRIEAGSDFFLMPSCFEPCGLNQMYSLRYGTIPIVHAVGGLIDTVRDRDSPIGPVNGIKFYQFNKNSLQSGISSALKIFDDKLHHHKIMKTGMNDDYSWNKSSIIYEKLYAK